MKPENEGKLSLLGQHARQRYDLLVVNRGQEVGEFFLEILDLSKQYDDKYLSHAEYEVMQEVYLKCPPLSGQRELKTV